MKSKEDNLKRRLVRIRRGGPAPEGSGVQWRAGGVTETFQSKEQDEVDNRKEALGR